VIDTFVSTVISILSSFAFVSVMKHGREFDIAKNVIEIIYRQVWHYGLHCDWKVAFWFTVPRSAAPYSLHPAYA
jgi:hypothetical protein